MVCGFSNILCKGETEYEKLDGPQRRWEINESKPITLPAIMTDESPFSRFPTLVIRDEDNVSKDEKYLQDNDQKTPRFAHNVDSSDGFRPEDAHQYGQSPQAWCLPPFREIKNYLSTQLVDHASGPDRMKIQSILNGSGDFESLPDRTVKESPLSQSPSPSTLSRSPWHNAAKGRRRARRQRKKARLDDPRSKYTIEEGHFIWYYRTDLHLSWDRVAKEFVRWFGDERKKGGLQCKYYRVLAVHGIEKVREQGRWGQKRGRDRVGKFGLLATLRMKYEWMRPEHRR